MIEPMDVLVQAGHHERHACPVWVQLPLQEGGGIPSVQMSDETGAAVACQLEPSGTGSQDRLWLTWIVHGLAAGQERRYRIEAAQTASMPEVHAEAPGVRAETPEAHAAAPTDHGPGVVLAELPDGQLSVHLDGALFTTYFFGSDMVRPYFHPLIGPTGKPVTRGYPMIQDLPGETRDHPHHRGFYVAHGDVNGADHWSEGANHATMRHAGFTRLVSGPVYGGFDETVEWLDREARVILSETRRLTFFNLSGGRGGAEKLFDVSLRFSASSGTVTFGDTKEGGLIALRVASSMDAKGQGRIENSYGGQQEAETWGKRSMWCDYSGPVDGDIVGVCLMDHPTNPRYPTHWHVRAYGLMTANPFGLHDYYKDSDTHRGDWTIPSHESRNFIYRVLLHGGGTAQVDVRERYHDFVNPPAAHLL